MTQFLDLSDAGKQLARRLTNYTDHENIVVLAVPPDGVPIAVEVAKILHAPLDVCLIRRLKVPELRDAPAGTVISGGLWTLNNQIVSENKVSLSDLDELVHSERQQLEELEKYYRAGRPALNLSGQVTVLVDDGHTNALSLRAILTGLQSKDPQELVLAVPAMAKDRRSVIEGVVDHIVTIKPWESLAQESDWYKEHNSSRSHQEIRNALKESQSRGSFD